MLKRLIVSESQKNEILNLHHILNEEDGTFSIEGSVIDGLNKREIPFARLSLKQNDKTLKEIQADINAKFKFDKLSSGSYSVVISAKNEGYTDKTEEVTINNQNIIDLTFKLEKLKELQEVKVGEIQITIFDFYFLNYKGKPIKDVNITLKSPTTSWKKELQTSNGKISASFDSFGNYVNDTDTIKVNKSLNKNEQFYSESTSCTEFKTIDIDIEYKKDKKFTKQIEYCIKNGSYKASELTTEEENVVMRKPSTKPQRFDNAVNSNIYKIEIPRKFKSTFKISNTEDKPLPNVVVNFYSDKTMTNLIESLQTDNDGIVIFEKLQSELVKGFGDVENNIKLYISAELKGYNSFSGSKNIDADKEEKIKITLKSIKEPKPAKPMSFRECKKEIREYYRNYIKTIKKGNSIEDAGGEQLIIDSKEQVKWCYINYQKRYSERYERAIRRLRNTATNYDVFEINFTIQQQQDIYKENYTMSLRNSIRKVIFEQNEINTSNVTEKKIIGTRLHFVLENSNRRNLKRNLLEESKKLVRTGYNREFVKESFMDIMTGMKDPKTFLTDIKNQLGQKIADTVKDKQQEHELIIGAFNELDPSVIERAFKENKTDELSEIIATKALENYKTQFGDGGIMGSLVASVDLGKFKTEVSKLLQTAINQMNTEMTDKIEKSASSETE